MKSVVFCFLLLPLLVIFSNCSNRNNPPLNETVKVIKIENITKDKLLVWDSSKIIIHDIIQLENSANSNLQDIFKGVVCDNKIYLHDFINSLLKVFDMNGKLLYSVGAKGKGPGEYHECRDFTLQNDNIYTLDYKKLHKYDSDGNYIKSIIPEIDSKNGFNPVSFALFDDENYYLYNSNPDVKNPNEVEYYRLHKYIGIKAKEVYFKYDHRVTDGNYFYPSYDNSYYMKPLQGSNEVYKIYKDSIKLKFKYDFGKESLPSDYFETNDENDMNAPMRNEYFKMVDKIFEIESEFLYFECSGPRSYTYISLIDLRSGKNRFGRQDYPYSPFVFYCDGQYFYAYYEPWRLMKVIEEKTDSYFFNVLRERLPIISKDDNFIIVKFSFKHG